jgi:peptidoglycan/LPS O-acetylase OafA/YrhL
LTIEARKTAIGRWTMYRVYILWSLSIEEYFYLLWAPVVLRFSTRVILAAGIAICLLETILRWAVSTPDVYFGVAFRFDALLYGAFLAILLDHWRRFSTPQWAQRLFGLLFVASGTGIAVILWAIRPVLGRDPRSSSLFLALGLPLLSVAGAALIGLLILRSGGEWWLGKLLRTQVFQFVGTISYTMYLVHLIAAAIVRALFRVNDVFHQTFLQAVLSTLLTIAIAQLSWIFLEKKFLHWKDKRFPNAPHPPEPNVPGLGSAA